MLQSCHHILCSKQSLTSQSLSCLLAHNAGKHFACILFQRVLTTAVVSCFLSLQPFVVVVIVVVVVVGGGVIVVAAVPGTVAVGVVVDDGDVVVVVAAVVVVVASSSLLFPHPFG